MGINKYNSQLEAYFSGKMSETDRILFEGRAESDPMLKTEFDRQSDIVDGLKAHRKAELKTRLNNISVEPTLIGTLMQGSMMKSLTYGVTAVMVAAGGYLFYNKDAAVQYHVEALDSKSEYIISDQIQLNINHNLDYRYEGNLQVMDFVDATPVFKKKKIEPSSNQQIIAFEVPEVTTRHEEVFEGSDVDLGEMDKMTPVAGVSDIEKVNIQTIISRKYNFHYRLEDNRLFLYGKFNESPYEIIEISTSSSKKLFFYYDGDFFQLQKNAALITPLSKIENRELIQELDALKGRG